MSASRVLPAATAGISARDRAKKHFAKVFAFYQSGAYLKAVHELKTAYSIRPVPVGLFYIGKTFQAAKLNEESARAFWQFLDEATLKDPKRSQAEKALKPGGVFSLSIETAFNYIGEAVGDYAGSVYATLTEVFPHVVVTPDPPTRFFCSLKQGVVSGDPAVLAGRYAARGIQPAELAHYFEQLLPEGRVEWFREKLDLLKSRARLNSDSRPVAYFFNLVLWQVFSSSPAFLSSSFSSISRFCFSSFSSRSRRRSIRP